MKIIKVFLVFGFVFLSSCASLVTIKEVKITYKDLPFTCEKLGEVTGSRSEIRRSGAEMGANVVKIEAVSKYGFYTASSYLCPMRKDIVVR